VPSFREFSAAHIQIGERLFPEWTRRPFPRSWEEFEATVNEWLQIAWGADWRCPHCSHRFWIVLEAVRWDSAVAWPIGENSSYGVYPIVPVTCAWCRQITPVLLSAIFEKPDGATAEPEGDS